MCQLSAKRNQMWLWAKTNGTSNLVGIGRAFDPWPIKSRPRPLSVSPIGGDIFCQRLFFFRWSSWAGIHSSAEGVHFRRLEAFRPRTGAARRSFWSRPQRTQRVMRGLGPQGQASKSLPVCAAKGSTCVCSHVSPRLTGMTFLV